MFVTVWIRFIAVRSDTLRVTLVAVEATLLSLWWRSTKEGAINYYETKRKSLVCWFLLFRRVIPARKAPLFREKLLALFVSY
jgi:hypothetical protein